MSFKSELAAWCRDHLGSRAPRELIDPDGEGVYLLTSVDAWTLQDAAHRVGATDDRGRPLWREIGREYVFMRQRGDEWFRVPTVPAGMDRSEMRTSRQRLSALGDGVQVQLGILAGEYVMSLEADRIARAA